MAADSNHLSYLPTEIICFILEQLDPITLTHCTEVCRQLNAVVKDSHLYQYNRQLALANLEDDRSNYSNGTLARLHMLEQHQRAWNAFTWSSSRTYNLLSTHAWELAGGVLGLCDTGNVLKFNRPPSVYRGIEQEEWHFKLDELERIEDFTFDPSQNILVVLTRHASERGFCIDAHMLTLESGRPHPSATHTKQRVFESEIDGESPEFDIRIFKSRLGIMIVSVDDEFSNKLVVWDWYEGRVALRIDVLASFAFLNESLVVFTPITNSDCLGDVTVVDLDCENSDLSILLHFKLPPFSDLDEVVIHSETHSPTSPGQREVPFGVSQRDRLLVLGCHLSDKDVAILAPLTTVLRHVENARSTRGLVLAWDDWGRDGTKLVQADFPDIWVCYVHGLRAVLLDCTDGQPPVSGTRFSLYDLNPLASQRNRHEVDRSKSAQDPEGGLPRTNAPCRVLSGLVPDTLPSSIMLSEDALLVVSEDETEITIYSF